MGSCRPRGAAGPVALTITFVQPDRRARDRDNLLAALKPSLDGLADALGVNDAQFEPCCCVANTAASRARCGSKSFA
jgi:Holliday junction resolvase RusA-like endonuclease